MKIFPFRLPEHEFKKRKYDEDYRNFGFTKAKDKDVLF